MQNQPSTRHGDVAYNVAEFSVKAIQSSSAKADPGDFEQPVRLTILPLLAWFFFSLQFYISSSALLSSLAASESLEMTRAEGVGQSTDWFFFPLWAFLILRC